MEEPKQLNVEQQEDVYLERSINNAARIIASADASAAIVIALDEKKGIHTLQYVDHQLPEEDKEKIRAVFFDAIKAFDQSYLATYGEVLADSDNAEDEN